MADVQSWAWYSTTPWPGFSLTNQDNLGANGNGLSVQPSTYTTVTLRDANADGILHDADSDDASTNPVDRVVVGGAERTIQEIAAYANSTVVLDGVTYSDRLLAVGLFSDESFAVRLTDDWVPEGHYKKVSQITLGTFNNTEYAGAYTAKIDSPFICLVAGTRIATPEGLRPVEALRPGDAVLTLDRGVQPILWARHRQVCGTGAQAPIRFAPGVLGNGRALKLSPQHRVLIRWPPAPPRARQEVLVAAHHLRDAGRIRPAAPCQLSPPSAATSRSAVGRGRGRGKPAAEALKLEPSESVPTGRDPDRATGPCPWPNGRRPARPALP